jgi:hypothetical protein
MTSGYSARAAILASVQAVPRKTDPDLQESRMRGERQ